MDLQNEVETLRSPRTPRRTRPRAHQVQKPPYTNEMLAFYKRSQKRRNAYILVNNCISLCFFCQAEEMAASEARPSGELEIAADSTSALNDAASPERRVGNSDRKAREGRLHRLVAAEREPGTQRTTSLTQQEPGKSGDSAGTPRAISSTQSFPERRRNK